MSDIITTKKKILFDNAKQKYGFSCNDTEISVVDPVTGEVIFKSKNKIILPGSGFTARAHFDLTDTEVVDSYNTLMGLRGNASVTDSTEPGVGVKERVYLFCVGTDGCGPEAAQRYPVDYTKAMLPKDLVDDPTLGYMIPFRYQGPGNDLSSTLRQKYFGKRDEVLDGVTWSAYYFKTFETSPVLYRKFTDDTVITKDTDIYHSTKSDEAQCYVELRLKITKEDFRDYFQHTIGLNEARWNSLSLCTAWPSTFTDSDGKQYTTYYRITPLTKLHIPNESLLDTSKEYDIIYHIYY